MHSNNDPFRWKKHLVLPLFKIREYEKLAQAIKRYGIKDLSKLIQDVGVLMRQNSNIDIYIVTFISQKKLSNPDIIMIKTLEDLEKLNDIDVRDYMEKYSEIWLEKVKVDEKTSMGLMTYVYYPPEQEMQTIEMIWNKDQRLLVKYEKEENDLYLRSLRKEWGSRYDLKELKNLSEEGTKKEEIAIDMKQAITKIEEKKEEIENFRKYLYKLKMISFSLEFKIENNEFDYIDFHTANDSKVVNSIFGNQQER